MLLCIVCTYTLINPLSFTAYDTLGIVLCLKLAYPLPNIILKMKLEIHDRFVGVKNRGCGITNTEKGL